MNRINTQRTSTGPATGFAKAATTSTVFDIAPTSSGSNCWRVAGRNIPIGPIQGIVPAQAGVDFPTDGPPDLNRDFSVLLVGSQRVSSLYKLAIERQDGVAGVDYPTDTPPPTNLVLSRQGSRTRIPVEHILAISSKAGEDFPTEVAPRYVLKTTDGQRIALNDTAPSAGWVG